MMKTAVIYARYSSDKQTEQSIEGQLRVCEDYAKRNDIIITGTYIDRAMTGTNDLRPDFQKMLKDSNKKEWDYVLVYKLDRFSRDKYETAKHKHELKKNGIKVLSAMENIPDTPEGIILESVIEGMNEYYSKELSQKVKRGMNESRIKGNFTGGTIPFGYKLNGKKIEIDNQNSEIIKIIFNEYVLGISCEKIIDELTSQGLYFYGNKFKKNTVYRILKNEKYTGIYKLHEQVFDNIYPKIIDIELFQKAQVKASSYQAGKQCTKSLYLFRNKLICGYCGNPISSDTSRTRKNEKYDYYKCLGIKKYHNHCQKETFRKEVLEKFLMENITNALQKPKIMSEIIKQVLLVQDGKKDNNSILNNLIRSKVQNENALNNLIHAIENGIMSPSTNKRLNELEQQIAEIDKQIVIEKNKTNMLLTETDIRKFYKDALMLNAYKIVALLIDKIVLYNDKAEIYFTSPIEKSPDEQGFLLFTNNSYLSKEIQYFDSLNFNVKINYYI